jgi:hypothetical protein
MYRKGTDTLGFAAGGNATFEVLTDKVRVSGSTHSQGRMYIETMDEFTYNGIPDRFVIWKNNSAQTPGTDKGELEYVSGCTIQKTTCPRKRPKKPWWRFDGFNDILLEYPASYLDDSIDLTGPLGTGTTFNDTVEQFTGRTNSGTINIYGQNYAGGGVLTQDSNNGKIQGGNSIVGIGAASLALGNLCYLSTTVGGGSLGEFTQWKKVDADSPTTSTGLLGICLSATTSADDLTYMALDGFVTVDNDLINNKAGTPTDDRGKPVYISAGTAGQFDMNPPTGAGEVVRIIGYVINSAGGVGNAYLIRFNPDNTWIEL